MRKTHILKLEDFQALQKGAEAFQFAGVFSDHAAAEILTRLLRQEDFDGSVRP